MYTDGRICLSILKQTDWSPIINLHTVLTSIRSLLSDPNCDSPANKDAAKIYIYDRHVFEMKVR